MAQSTAMIGDTAAVRGSDGASDRKLHDAMARGRETLSAAFAVMGRNRTKDLKDPTAYELCLTPFLEAVGWVGEDRRLIEAVIEKFDGGPVGVESLSAAIGEERGTIEDVIEPYLIQQGFLMRTPRGRVVTSKGYTHFGFPHANRQDQIDF